MVAKTGEVVFIVSSDVLGALESTSLIIEVNARLFVRALEYTCLIVLLTEPRVVICSDSRS